MKRFLTCILCLALLCASAALAEPLKKGAKGDEVAALQVKLIEHNYLDDSADGSFGGKTEKAIKQVQADAGFEQTGIADDQTMDYLAEHYAEFTPKKDSDIQFYALDFDTSDSYLTIHLKNKGRQDITGFKFKLYQCNASKGSLGSFYGDRNKTTKKRRYTNWSEHGASIYLASGECDYRSINLEEGHTVEFSDGSTQVVTYFEKGAYARVVVSEYTTEDGKTHKVNQQLYAKFR